MSLKSTATDRIRAKLEGPKSGSPAPESAAQESTPTVPPEPSTSVTISVENLAALLPPEVVAALAAPVEPEKPHPAPSPVEEVKSQPVPEPVVQSGILALHDALSVEEPEPMAVEETGPAQEEPEQPIDPGERSYAIPAFSLSVSEPLSQDRTKLWIGIGAAAVVIIGIAFFAIRGSTPKPVPAQQAVPQTAPTSAPAPATETTAPAAPQAPVAQIPSAAVPSVVPVQVAPVQAAPAPPAQPEIRRETNAKAFIPPAPKAAPVPVRVTELPPTAAATVPASQPPALGSVTIPALKPPPPAPAEETKPTPPVSQNAVLLKTVQPTYPAVARQARVQGMVVLSITVGRDGSVTTVHPISGSPLLIPAAQDAVRQWKYRPSTLNGETVESTFAVQVRFSLDGSQGR